MFEICNTIEYSIKCSDGKTFLCNRRQLSLFNVVKSIQDDLNLQKSLPKELLVPFERNIVKAFFKFIERRENTIDFTSISCQELTKCILWFDLVDFNLETYFYDVMAETHFPRINSILWCTVFAKFCEKFGDNDNCDNIYKHFHECLVEFNIK